ISHKVSDRLPQEEKALFLHLYRQKPLADTKTVFRHHLLEALGSRIRQPAALIDSVLYEQAPLLPLNEAKEALAALFAHLGVQPKEVRLEGAFFGPHDLYQIAKGLLLESLKTPFSPI